MLYKSPTEGRWLRRPILASETIWAFAVGPTQTLRFLCVGDWRRRESTSYQLVKVMVPDGSAWGSLAYEAVAAVSIYLGPKMTAMRDAKLLAKTKTTTMTEYHTASNVAMKASHSPFTEQQWTVAGTETTSLLWLPWLQWRVYQFPGSAQWWTGSRCQQSELPLEKICERQTVRHILKFAAALLAAWASFSGCLVCETRHRCRELWHPTPWACLVPKVAMSSGHL